MEREREASLISQSQVELEGTAGTPLGFQLSFSFHQNLNNLPFEASAETE